MPLQRPEGHRQQGQPGPEQQCALPEAEADLSPRLSPGLGDPAAPEQRGHQQGFPRGRCMTATGAWARPSSSLRSSPVAALQQARLAEAGFCWNRRLGSSRRASPPKRRTKRVALATVQGFIAWASRTAGGPGPGHGRGRPGSRNAGRAARPQNSNRTSFKRSASSCISATSASGVGASKVTLKRRYGPASSQGTVEISLSMINH